MKGMGAPTDKSPIMVYKERRGKEGGKKERTVMEREGTSEARVIEGYGCICGFVTEEKKEFQSHVMLAAARDGKGIHKSLGYINTQTGEVLMPPWQGRTKAQREASSHAKRGKEGTGREGTKEGTGREGTEKSEKKRLPRTTEVLADAEAQQGGHVNNPSYCVIYHPE